MVTLLETIDGVNRVLPVFVIFQGKKGHLYDWFTHLTEEDHENVYAISPTGWTNQILGVEYLDKLFIPYIRQRHPPNEWVLLIVDGHNSHFSTDFIRTCESSKIELFGIPPHSTHLLQPLDVGLFSPLQHHYAIGIDNFARTHNEAINKRNFLPYVLKLFSSSSANS